MQITQLDDMFKGWFVGNFQPNVVPSEEVEVGIKYYKAGEIDNRHYHKVAIEITAIVSGRGRMNNNIIEAGQIVVIDPKESTDFEALEDTITCVIKLPSVKGDKYLGEYGD